jgi:hypothetical protein
MVGERFLPIARAAVDDQLFEAAWAEGRQMGYDAAVGIPDELLAKLLPI